MLISIQRAFPLLSLTAIFLPSIAHAESSTFSYATNYGTNSYSECSVEANGDLDKCTTSTPANQGALSGPSSLQIHNNYAYITNTDNNSYTQCAFENSTRIDLSSCKTFYPSGAGSLNHPSGIAFNGSNAYITNAKNGTYTACHMSDTGIESSTCQTFPTMAASSVNPTAMAFAGNRAYILNFDTNNYTSCQVNNDIIDPNTCKTYTPPVAGSFNGPTGIAFFSNSYVGKMYAYISNLNNNSYTQCKVNDNIIDPNSCKTVILKGAAALSAPTALAVSLEGKMYFANMNGNSYTKCKIDYNGIESSSCTTNSSNYFLSPTGLDFH